MKKNLKSKTVHRNLNSRVIHRTTQRARGTESDSLLGIFILLAAAIGGAFAFAIHEVFVLLTTAMEVAF